MKNKFKLVFVCLCVSLSMCKLMGQCVRLYKKKKKKKQKIEK